jgi:cytoskeleton protein RodZ
MTKDSTSADDANGQPAVLSQSDETLGGFLRKHRQSQGKDLDEIAKKTRIHASTLRAIEEDNPKALPAEVFARGFVKNYAQYLGLDPNEALAWYIKQNAGDSRPTEKNNGQEVLAGEAMAEAQTFPVGRFIVFFLVVGVFFLAGYLVLSFLNSSVPPADISTKNVAPQAQVEPQPSLVTPVVGGPGSEPDAENVRSGQAPLVTQGGAQDPALALPGPVPVTTRQEEKKAPALPEKTVQGIEPQKVDGEHGLGGKKKTDDIKPVIVPQAIKEKPGQVSERQDAVNPASVSVVSPMLSTVKAPGMNYVLEAKFTEPTWLSVQIDKEKKKSSIYQPGDRMVWQAEKKISLFVGNAGGVALTLNGKKMPSLGKSMDSARVSFPTE